MDVIFFTKQVLDTEWRPAGLHITFGLLSDSLIAEKLTTINYLYVYLFALIIIAFLTMFSDFTRKINWPKNLSDSLKDKLEIYSNKNGLNNS